jgi:hypothetical protein
MNGQKHRTPPWWVMAGWLGFVAVCLILSAATTPAHRAVRDDGRSPVARVVHQVVDTMIAH